MFDQKVHACIANRTLNRFVYLVLTIIFVIPVVMIIFSYSTIISRVRHAYFNSCQEQKIHQAKMVEDKDLVEPDTMKETQFNSVSKELCDIEALNPEPDHLNERVDELKKTLKLLKGLVLSFVITIFTFVPFLIISNLDFEQNWPAYIHLYSWLFFRLCSAINPIIYPIYYSSFLEGYLIVYYHTFYKKKIAQLKLKKRKNPKKKNPKKKNEKG